MLTFERPREGGSTSCRLLYETYLATEAANKEICAVLMRDTKDGFAVALSEEALKVGFDKWRCICLELHERYGVEGWVDRTNKWLVKEKSKRVIYMEEELPEWKCHREKQDGDILRFFLADRVEGSTKVQAVGSFIITKDAAPWTVGEITRK